MTAITSIQPTNPIESLFKNIQSEFKKIVKEIYVNNPTILQSEPSHTYILLTQKISHNLNSASHLATDAYVSDTGLILRSAFESLLLLKLFSHFPEEIITWNTESEIVNFRNQFILHRFYPETRRIDDLMAQYQALSPEAQKLIDIETSITLNNLLTYKQDKLGKKLQSFKCKYCKEITSTNVRDLIKKIIEREPESSSLERLRWYLYDSLSQLHHSIQGAILSEYTPKPFEVYKESFKDFYRRYCLIATQLIVTLQKHTFMKDIAVNNYFQALRTVGISLGAFEEQPTRN